MADTNMLEKEEQIREALRTVIDPEIGLNVIELGLIRSMDITPESVHITMIMTTPFCPYGPQLLEMSRRAAEGAAGVPATIEVGTEMWDPSYMEEGAGGDWGLF